MSWFYKIALYWYKGRRPCHIIDNMGSGRVLVEFKDDHPDRAEVFRSHLTSRPRLDIDESRIVECPNCNIVNDRSDSRCKVCNEYI